MEACLEHIQNSCLSLAVLNKCKNSFCVSTSKGNVQVSDGVGRQVEQGGAMEGMSSSLPMSCAICLKKNALKELCISLGANRTADSALHTDASI